MTPYLNLVSDVLTNGERRTDRTGVGTRSLFGVHARYDLRDGFPAVTTKRLQWTSVVKELLWFLRGETNVKTLGCGIWDAWSGPIGEVGPVYGHVWRDFGGSYYPKFARDYHPDQMCGLFTGVDQIGSLVRDLRRDPTSRRHIVTAWDPTVLGDVGLPPCHVLFQCYVTGDNHLDLQLYQRSADLGLGVPFNVASYALLMHLLARETGLTPRYFIHAIGDAHVYENHVDALVEQLTREPRPLPRLRMDVPSWVSIETDEKAAVLTPDMFVLEGYDPHQAIRMEVAV